MYNYGHSYIFESSTLNNIFSELFQFVMKMKKSFLAVPILALVFMAGYSLGISRNQAPDADPGVQNLVEVTATDLSEDQPEVTKVITDEGGEVTFETKRHNFGKVNQNEPARHRFVFTNNTDEPIKISNVKASCQCTSPFWTKEEIQPGEKGYVEAEYNAKRVGVFNKSVTVSTSAGTFILSITGEVVAKENLNLNNNSMLSTPQE